VDDIAVITRQVKDLFLVLKTDKQMIKLAQMKRILYLDFEWRNASHLIAPSWILLAVLVYKAGNRAEDEGCWKRDPEGLEIQYPWRRMFQMLLSHIGAKRRRNFTLNPNIDSKERKLG
jgi:hypothetical protein